MTANHRLPELGSFLATCGTTITKRATALLTISVSAWIPFLLIAGALAFAGGLIEPLTQAADTLTRPTSEPVALTFPNPAAAIATAAVITIGYLWTAAFSSAAVAHQTNSFLNGTPENTRTSLTWGLKRSGRATFVLITLTTLAITLIAAATAAVILTARTLAIGGLDVTAAVIVSLGWYPIAGLVFLAIYNRLTLAIAAAALDTRGNPISASWRATRGRFFPVLIRWLLVALIVAGVTGTIAGISAVLGLTGITSLILAALAIRILITAIGNAAQITATTVLYRQTETPTST